MSGGRNSPGYFSEDYIMLFTMKEPCTHCPFRNDIRAYLNEERVEEILQSLDRETFACHKTIEHDDDGEGVYLKNTQHCAGALILLEKVDKPGQIMRIAERLGLYDRHKLNMNAPVFNSFEEMIEANRY